MKVKMIFDMSNLDDQVEHQHAINGRRLACVLHDFDQWLRAQYKYEGKETIDVDELREKLREFVRDQGLEFDSIVF